MHSRPVHSHINRQYVCRKYICRQYICRQYTCRPCSHIKIQYTILQIDQWVLSIIDQSTEKNKTGVKERVD